MGIEILIEPLEYDFMVRALITALLSGIMLSVLGSFTINKNMGFMADAMAHATLPIIAVGVFFGFSISSLGAPAAIMIALFLGFIIKNTNIGEDTSIGIIFSSFFALGFVLISVLDVSINLEDLLFGQILAVSTVDVFVIFILASVVLSTLFLFFKQILFYSFDPLGAQVRNLNVTFLNYLFLIILSLSIVGSLQTVGIVLVLSMLLIPAAAAKLVTKTFVKSIKISAFFGGVSSVAGLYLSYYFNLPSGPTMSLVASGIFMLSLLSRKLLLKRKLIIS
ncbi:metal ABC transporter permease [bacterium]|jgi:manganese/iron transport system permease protein|nr:metal ABC transporter permease [Flavobacterium sp.]MBT5188234.1 metal ABC transporter permease [Kordiimonadaceae bacterium]MDA9593348.1 metal ABC transporter permease [Candidatus Actinomarina sp.]MDA9608212.1 metal ABC transporter permease [Candidatus Actinomarina sp.]MDA9655326.1 metal ABC transporter permease [bacterium]|tara:strand:- start:746 stop:1582 length:837 start_codon:yes stop_codon:yes gene_type:complete